MPVCKLLSLTHAISYKIELYSSMYMYRLSIIYIKHSGVLQFIISYVLPSLLVNGFHDLNPHSKKLNKKATKQTKVLNLHAFQTQLFFTSRDASKTM